MGYTSTRVSLNLYLAKNRDMEVFVNNRMLFLYTIYVGIQSLFIDIVECF